MESTRVGNKILAPAALAAMMLVSTVAHAIPNTCVLPETAADDWQSEVPTAECVVAGEAEKVCKTWVKTCKKVVNKAASCRLGEVSAGASIEKAACKLSTVGDPKQCKDDAVAEMKILKEDTKVQKAAALLECEAYFDDCVFFCNL